MDSSNRGLAAANVQDELSHGLSIIELEERLEMVSAGSEEYDEAEIDRCERRCIFGAE